MKKCILFACYLVLLFPLCAMGGARYYPLRFEVTGIPDAKADKNAMIALQNLRNSLTFPFNEHDVRHFYKKAPKAIQTALTPYGYFQSAVQSSLTKSDHFWIASFHVSPGPPLPITALTIHIQGPGASDLALIAWKKNVPLTVGQTVNTITYENVKTSLNNLATQRGYFSAKMIKSQIQIDLTKYVAHVIIIYNTGPRYYFGDTRFSKTLLHEKFLRRFLKYRAGEHYDATQLEKTQSGLLSGNFFSQVLVKPDLLQSENNIVPINIDLIPRKSKEYLLGAGYGTDTGMRGTLGLTWRNIGHHGHRFQTLLRGSEDNSSFVAKYLIPGFDPARDLFTIAAGAGSMSQPGASARNAKFALAYTISRGFWKNSLSFAYLTERYNLINLPKTSTMLVYPTWDTQYLRLDRKTEPNRGVRFDLQLTGATKDALSQTDFFQAVMKLATLYTISPTKTRFIFRTNVGHTNIVNLSQLPLSLQLFAGGSHSLRGYEYNSIGPGRNMVLASTELQQRVYGSLYLIGFADAGVVANENIFHYINVGTGPGIAWIATIGTIELTVAKAVTQPTEPWTIQFSMGTFL